jgi:hypothetical protein
MERVHPNGGEAKFLEKGALAAREQVDTYILSELKKVKG